MAKRKDLEKRTFLGEPIYFSQKMDDEKLVKFLDIYSKTKNKTKAAKAIGITYRTILKLEEKSEEFRQLMKEAADAYADDLLEDIRAWMEKKKSASAGLKLLGKLKPDEYGQKTTHDVNIKVGVLEMPVGENQLERVVEYEEATIVDDDER